MTLPGKSAPARIAALAAAVLSAAFAAGASAQDGAASDRAALEALYDATGGAGWTENANWKTSAPLGEWYGVTTDADGRVTELDLAGNALTGSIPAAVGRLGFLRRLDFGSRWDETSQQSIDDNALTGPIPAELGSLANLETLDLSDNELTGPIPVELGRLVNLEGLRLGWNDLTGPIPSELGNLVHLRSLVLSSNTLTGSIPVELGRLEDLEELFLWGNAVSGPIPSELGRLMNLRNLSLGGNDLTGRIPAELGNLTNLSWLALSYNDLTGAIPVELGRLESLAGLSLGGNDLTGRIPAELGNLANLTRLELGGNDLTGPIPAELGSLTNLERLDLSYNWGLAGPLPSGLELSSLEELDFFVTQACAPDDWREWLATIEFYGPPCGAGADLEIDIAVVYTPAAREAAGGASAIEAEIDLMIAETNEAYAASGVPQRLALAGRSEAPYTETDGHLDVRRLREPSDGHLDEAHTLRDRVGADLVHLIVSDPYYDVCGMAAGIPGVFGLTLLECGGLTFAHELGHNMGLRHDRFRVDVFEGSLSSHPAYGYVNQRVFDASAPRSAQWMTIMSYVEHCRLADVACVELPRFSNPRQRYDGDPLGVPFGTGSGLTGPSDAAAVLGAMGPAVAAWRDRPADAANRPPVVVGTLSDPSLDSVGDALDVDVSQAFVDPDGDSLTYTVSSAEPWLVRVHAAGAVVTLTGAGEGTATIRVTATDPGGLSVSSAFSVTVEGPADPDPQGTVESDRAALEALYDATDGPDWTDSTSWKTSAPLDEWFGVETDADGRVTGLSLADNGVAGPIPFEMASLVKLETLDLCLNDLSGPIPAALGGLVNLRWLALCFNDLSGPIPVELGKLASLEWLGLYFNDLSGPIPAELGGLVNLGALILSGNDLTGSIPARLGNLTQLRGLSLGRNELSGSIPGALEGLANLERLDLTENDLTGPIPRELRSLANLEFLRLDDNALTGQIPPGLGSLASLRTLDLSHTDLSGRIPASLGNLASLETLDLSYAWGLSGPLPPGLEQSALDELDIFVTRTCAPAAWDEWLATIEFWGPSCGAGPNVTIDVAVVYTPAAREAAGGAAAVEAAIDLMIAETNHAYAASGMDLRLALVARSEVSYTETGGQDVYRLRDPSDGHMDEVHDLRDEVGADLVHLILGEAPGLCGIAAGIPSVFGLTVLECGGIVFAHELGHNLGLRHDRFQVQVREGGVSSHPAYGYVNQGMFGAGAPPSTRWRTVMAYGVNCGLADAGCPRLPRFSNPDLRYDGDPLGVAFGAGSGVTGASDAAAVLHATGPAAAAWRDRPPRANRAPVAVGTLPDRRLSLDGRLDVNVSPTFDDPDGDPLTYAVSSSAASVVTVRALGPSVTLTGVGEGTATIRVTATDPGGLSAAQQFRVTVAAAPAPFTDDPIRSGVTPIRAVHFTELRSRIAALRTAAGLAPFRWTDPVLRAGVTRVRLVHLLELREALAAAYVSAGRTPPRWTDSTPMGGTTPIRAAHLTELRVAVVALERG